MALAAVDLDNVTFAAQRLADVGSHLMAPGVVIDGDTVHALHVHFAVGGHNGLAGGHGLGQNAVEVSGRVGVHHDHVDGIIIDEIADDVGLLVGVPVGGVVDDLIILDAAFGLVLLSDLGEIVDTLLAEGSACGAGREADYQVAGSGRSFGAGIPGIGRLLLCLPGIWGFGTGVLAAAAPGGQSQEHHRAE